MEPANQSKRLPAGVWLSATGVVALLLAVSSRYGFHRDELYFVVAGRRLDWGFVDQPPLTPLVARLAELVGGTNPTALRVLPALAVGGVSLLAAVMTRRFGGGRVAQVFAAVSAGWVGVLLGEGHLLSTAVFDYFLWTLSLWILVRILDGADPRWWVGLGVVVGIGLENKHMIGFFAAAVLIAILAGRRRSVLAGPWPWFGVALAAVIALPNLIWQASNGWPQLEMSEAIRARSDGPLLFVLLQAGLLSIALAVPAAVGFWRLLRSGSMTRWRPMAIAYVVLFVFFLVTGGKAYYLAPMYSVLLAAGALWFEDMSTLGRKWMAGTAVAGIGVGLFIALPLLPPQSSGTLDLTGELAETVGWPELIAQIETVYLTIPESDRAATAIFTGSYGEAGAVDVLGVDRGLPAATSGHNNYWLWGPPTHHGPVIGVGQVGASLELVCPDLEQVGTIDNPYGVENEELGLPLYLCLQPTRQLSDVWDQIRHYN